tara:strand:+ start:162 stop:1394 length:1233 start_codon:yes stop_codon:yes gene_type:complete
MNLLITKKINIYHLAINLNNNNMKKIILVLSIMLAFNLKAQKMEITSAVIALDKHNDLESATKWIDIADTKINNGATLKPKFLSKFNHYKGLIYLKKYQKNIKSPDSFGFLNIATNSFIEDSKIDASFSKKSASQLKNCAYFIQDRAYNDYENKNYESALEKFSLAISVNSSPSIQKVDTFNMYNASLMAYQCEKYDESAIWSKSLIELDPTDVRFHTRLIDAYDKMGKSDLQLEAIKFARKSVPKSKDIIFSEVNFYLASGDNELLLESLDNAVKSDPDNPILHLVLGNTYNQIGNFEKSKSSFENAISLDAKYFDAYNNLASLYLDQTIDLIEKKNALSYKQKTQFEKYKKQINSLYSKALPHLEKCLEIDSNNLSIVTALKEIYYKLDMAKKSVEMKKLQDSLTQEN